MKLQYRAPDIWIDSGDQVRVNRSCWTDWMDAPIVFDDSLREEAAA